MAMARKLVAALELCLAVPLLAQPSADDASRHFAELLAWLQAGIDEAGLGAACPPLADTFELRTGGHGRSLFARRGIAAGSTLAMLPASRLVFERDFGGILDGLPPNEATPDREAIVFVAGQRQAASPWAPWIKVLPEVHSHLPKYWGASFLNGTLEGSHFIDYVHERREVIRSDWDHVRTVANISLLDYEWGYDIYNSRQFVWNGTGRSTPPKPGTRAFYPLVDLISHGEENVDFAFDAQLQALRVFATNPVRRGAEFFSQYFRPDEMDNFALLEMGGFALDGNRRGVVLRIPDAGPRFKLELTAENRNARQFLGYLRARVGQNGSINISSFVAGETDWVGVPDAATGWLYFWRPSTGETSWAVPGDPGSVRGGPVLTPATTWGVEREALRLGQTFLEAALARYPQTLAQDDELLAGDIPDVRLRFAVMLRRDEKFVLSWWQRLLHRAAAHAGEADAPVDVAESHLLGGDIEVGRAGAQAGHSEL